MVIVIVGITFNDFIIAEGVCIIVIVFIGLRAVSNYDGRTRYRAMGDIMFRVAQRKSITITIPISRAALHG